MNITDYPETLKRLKAESSNFEQLKVSSPASISIINKVRKEAGLAPIDVNELVTASLSRIEDKLTATEEIQLTEVPTLN